MKNKQSQASTIDFSTILASSVHDMKNSVGMLLSSVETLLEVHAPKNEQEARHFQILHYEASRINGELIQLLTLYRKDSGFLPLTVDEHYIVDVLEDQIARNQLLVDTSNMEVTLDCDSDLVWYFDADLIGGVVHNILVNCIRYTENKILVRAKTIEAEDGSGPRLAITVADNGPGYPKDMIANPTQRVNEALLAEGSTHLGLFFANEIAELHTQKDCRGSIKLKNNGVIGGGEFTLLLP